MGGCCREIALYPMSGWRREVTLYPMGGCFIEIALYPLVNDVGRLRCIPWVAVVERFYCIRFLCHGLFNSLASRLNGYMYSNGKSLNVALFILMANHLVLG